MVTVSSMLGIIMLCHLAREFIRVVGYLYRDCKNDIIEGI